MKMNEFHRHFVYVLHFSNPLYHSRHYVGMTYDIESRVQSHRGGYGHPLCKAIVDRGDSIEIARVWEFKSRSDARIFEIKLKNKHHTSRFCPLCKTTTNFAALHPTHPMVLFWNLMRQQGEDDERDLVKFAIDFSSDLPTRSARTVLEYFKYFQGDKNEHSSKEK